MHLVLGLNLNSADPMMEPIVILSVRYFLIRTADFGNRLLIGYGYWKRLNLCSLRSTLSFIYIPQRYIGYRDVQSWVADMLADAITHVDKLLWPRWTCYPLFQHCRPAAIGAELRAMS